MRKVKGFTLIELLIVVVIIGILATFVILLLSGATQKTKNARAKTSVKTVQTALGLMLADTTDLTASGGALGCSVSPCNVTLDSPTNFTKMKDINGAQLLASAPQGAQTDYVKIRVWSDGKYTISARAADWTAGATKCWGVSTSVTANASNLDSSTPASVYCI